MHGNKMKKKGMARGGKMGMKKKRLRKGWHEKEGLR